MTKSKAGTAKASKTAAVSTSSSSKAKKPSKTADETSPEDDPNEFSYCGSVGFLKQSMSALKATIENARAMIVAEVKDWNDDVIKRITQYRVKLIQTTTKRYSRARDQLLSLLTQNVGVDEHNEFKERLSGFSIFGVLKNADGHEVKDKNNKWEILFDLPMCQGEYFQFCSKKTNDEKSATFGIRHMESTKFEKTFELTAPEIPVESRDELNRKVMNLFAKFAAVIDKMHVIESEL